MFITQGRNRQGEPVFYVTAKGTSRSLLYGKPELLKLRDEINQLLGNGVADANGRRTSPSNLMGAQKRNERR